MAVLFTMRRIWVILSVCGAMLAGPVVSFGCAQTVIDSWNSIPVPPAPELHWITVDAENTALLILDMNAEACRRRPSCVRSIPHIQQMLTAARAHHMLVVYSTSASAAAAPVPEPLKRMADDPSVVSSADKFLGTDLEKTLANRGVKTVIVAGTTAEGAVLYTASAAALRKLTVIVPIDGYSSDTPFAELVTAWLLTKAPVSLSSHVTLTKTDMIAFR